MKQVLGEQAEMDRRDEQVNTVPSRETSDIDLESEMERQMGMQETGNDGEKPRDPASTEQQDSTPAESTDRRDPTGKNTEMTAEVEVHESEYGKHYRTGPQERESRSLARREKQEKVEQELRREWEKQEALVAKQAEEEVQGRKVVEQALPVEEEREAKERLAELCRISKDRRKPKTDDQRKKKKQRLEIDEEEEEEEKDDEDQDPDYNPDKDPENDFIDDESIFTEDQDVMEIEKHSHAINFKESGEYTVWIRDNLDELERAVKVGGGVAECSYAKFIELLRDGIMKMETYSPIEGSDVKQVMKTIVDPTCCAWRKKMKGVKTGNCHTIMKAEEKKEQVLKA